LKNEKNEKKKIEKNKKGEVLHILAWDNGIGPFGSGSLVEIN